MPDFIYSAEPGLIIGFHGCERAVCEAIISGKSQMRVSNKSWDCIYAATMTAGGMRMPTNVNPSADPDSFDYVIRRLDCAVIKQVHEIFHLTDQRPFDSVRALLPDGRGLRFH
jgi:hypothetical protein